MCPQPSGGIVATGLATLESGEYGPTHVSSEATDDMATAKQDSKPAASADESKDMAAAKQDSSATADESGTMPTSDESCLPKLMTDRENQRKSMAKTSEDEEVEQMIVMVEVEKEDCDVNKYLSSPSAVKIVR